MREARKGDIEALDNILRLDSSSIFDRKISQKVHYFRAHDKKKFDIITAAFSGQPQRKISVQKVKVLMASLISHISSDFEEKLTEPDIRTLFDAIARDQGLGDIDTDLPESPHAFYMAIKRELPFWEAAFDSHKK